jgi:hypothetical protein
VAANKPRRLVDAVDELRAEIRTANLLQLLALGTSALDDVDPSKSSAITARRQKRLNRARAEIRAALELEEVGHGDRG